ncbi:MAG TPA: hypothetical protein VK960_02230 [Acidimicrobiia bacterium]|nr:hypothetical protein [Acidimicrobiia bacterium]
MTNRRTFLLVTLVAASMVLLASPASADHLEVETEIPESVAAGETIVIRVIVRSTETGDRVPDAVVTVSWDVEFLGVAGRVEVARATTNDQGIATLRWQARGGVSEQIVVAYAASGGSTIESAPQSVITVTPGPQIVRSRSGVKIPGFGAWVLIAIVVGIWATIQFALLGPVQVARRAVEDGDAK